MGVKPMCGVGYDKPVHMGNEQSMRDDADVHTVFGKTFESRVRMFDHRQVSIEMMTFCVRVCIEIIVSVVEWPTVLFRECVLVGFDMRMWIELMGVDEILLQACTVVGADTIEIDVENHRVHKRFLI